MVFSISSSLLTLEGKQQEGRAEQGQSGPRTGPAKRGPGGGPRGAQRAKGQKALHSKITVLTRSPWLWRGGRAYCGSLCAIEVEGLKRRAPTEVGGLGLEFRV